MVARFSMVCLVALVGQNQSPGHQTAALGDLVVLKANERRGGPFSSTNVLNMFVQSRRNMSAPRRGALILWWSVGEERSAQFCWPPRPPRRAPRRRTSGRRSGCREAGG